MALLFEGKTWCALCGEVVQAGDEVVATSHFIADHGDPLWKYSDASFHKRCFVSWELRAEFVAKFNHICKGFSFGDGCYHQMQDDGGIISVKKTAQ
jgi:hypothetical protein